jgi:hypothetical protein
MLSKSSNIFQYCHVGLPTEDMKHEFTPVTNLPPYSRTIKRLKQIILQNSIDQLMASYVKLSIMLAHLVILLRNVIKRECFSFDIITSSLYNTE